MHLCRYSYTASVQALCSYIHVYNMHAYLCMHVCTHIYHTHNLGNVNICWKVQTCEKDRNYLTPKGERFNIRDVEVCSVLTESVKWLATFGKNQLSSFRDTRG